jgi:hypothetical protein
MMPNVEINLTTRKQYDYSSNFSLQVQGRTSKERAISKEAKELQRVK